MCPRCKKELVLCSYRLWIRFSTLSHTNRASDRQKRGMANFRVTQLLSLSDQIQTRDLRILYCSSHRILLADYHLSVRYPNLVWTKYCCLELELGPIFGHSDTLKVFLSLWWRQVILEGCKSNHKIRKPNYFESNRMSDRSDPDSYLVVCSKNWGLRCITLLIYSFPIFSIQSQSIFCCLHLWLNDHYVNLYMAI